MRLSIRGGRVLSRDAFTTTSVDLIEGQVAGIGSPGKAGTTIDATGLLVLPGIVDIHGDAFERQLQPRPGVAIAPDIALLETDRQLLANGITTAFHAVTRSWEPGLRSDAASGSILEAIERLRPQLAVDTRYHLRHETYNLDAEPEILDWLRTGRIGCLAFNDHMNGTIKERHRPGKIAKMVERSGLSADEFNALVDRTYARRDAVPASVARLAKAAVAAGIPVLSHDDPTPDQRAWYRELGVSIAEFPMTDATAAAAVAAREPTVFGAPNVIRGGSHTGCPAAAGMVAAGHCKILASDYYYPALLLAPFKLAELGVAQLEAAWQLISRNPAAALGLADRGELAVGKRADVVLIDATSGPLPRVAATIIQGRVRYLGDVDRLQQV
jgi:alpha-D-ribose 1-methylphosphonate 5-triphosphate diphosphatase